MLQTQLKRCIKHNNTFLCCFPVSLLNKYKLHLHDLVSSNEEVLTLSRTSVHPHVSPRTHLFHNLSSWLFCFLLISYCIYTVCRYQCSKNNILQPHMAQWWMCSLGYVWGKDWNCSFVVCRHRRKDLVSPCASAKPAWPDAWGASRHPDWVWVEPDREQIYERAHGCGEEKVVQ